MKKLKPKWFQILLAVADGPRHGQGIMAEVLKQTDGGIHLWPTSLYGSLKDLVNLGLLEETFSEGPWAEGDRRRFYGITGAGKQALGAEVRRLEKTLELARRKDVATHEV